MRRLQFAGVVAATVVGVFGVITAAGGPKPQPVPATMTFRCFAGGGGLDSCGPVSDDPATDRVRDDGLLYTGGSIDTSGVYNVVIAPTANRLLNLSLGSRIDNLRPCDTTGNCHPFLNLANTNLALDYFDIKVKPLTTNLSQDLAGGLYGMTTCQTMVYPALVHYTFWLPDGDGHWGLNFNPKAYPGTTAANLVRLTDTTWSVESVGDIAELLSWGHSGITRHDGPSHEGRFYVPFKLTIAATSPLPSGVGRCPQQ